MTTRQLFTESRRIRGSAGREHIADRTRRNRAEIRARVEHRELRESEAEIRQALREHELIDEVA